MTLAPDFFFLFRVENKRCEYVCSKKKKKRNMSLGELLRPLTKFPKKWNLRYDKEEA